MILVARKEGKESALTGTRLLTLWVVLAAFCGAAFAHPQNVRQDYRSPSGDLIATVIEVNEAHESRVEIYISGGTLVLAQDYSSNDMEHGQVICKAAWTPDGEFFVFSMKNTGGHSPLARPTRFYSRKQNRVFNLDDTLGYITEADFKLEAPDWVITKRLLTSGRDKSYPVRVVLSEVALQMASLEPGSSFEIRIPPEIRLDKLQFTYFPVGPFGGGGGIARTDSAKHSLVIGTTVNHQEAASLKAVLYAPGCQFQLFDIPSLEHSSRQAEYVCKDLPPMSFTGTIVVNEQLRAHPYEVRIDYMASWICAFFGLADCMIVPFHLAVAGPDANGVFQVDLPDFTQDSATKSYKFDAWFEFVAREKEGWNIVAFLTPTNGALAPFGHVKLRPDFPREITFKTRAR